MGAPIGNRNAAGRHKRKGNSKRNRINGMVRRPDHSYATLKKAGFKKTKFKGIYIL